MPNKRTPEPTDGLDADGARRGARAGVFKPFLASGANPGSLHDVSMQLDEAVGLAAAIGLDVVHAESFNLPHPSPATLLGSGQVERLAALVADKEIQLMILDHTLSPVQQRNLEKAFRCKVIDRTGLILEIFGDRARTHEGQLQVELAALSYQKSRLVRSWTHLERQRGGFGFIGGPGESQLEIDRRLITNRIAKLKDELEQVRRTRALQRGAREKAERPLIALVGYTNAGKSTLFNRLTGAGALVKDMLFATLDTSMRGLVLPSGREAILSDTVGFISDLPTHLVEAFRATLEEVQTADIILHVRDSTAPDTRKQKAVVEQILADLDVPPDDPRLIEVLNKIDRLPSEERAMFKDYASRTSWEAQHALDIEGLNAGARGGSVPVSALTGEGIDGLLHLLDETLSFRNRPYNFTIPLSEGAALAWLYKNGQILERADGAKTVHLRVALDPANYGRFFSKFGGVVHEKH